MSSHFVRYSSRNYCIELIKLSLIPNRYFRLILSTPLRWRALFDLLIRKYACRPVPAQFAPSGRTVLRLYLICVFYASVFSRSNSAYVYCAKKETKSKSKSIDRYFRRINYPGTKITSSTDQLYNIICLIYTHTHTYTRARACV